MRKKKIIAVVAAATLALSMVGCGSGGSGGSGGSSSSGVANKDTGLPLSAAVLFPGAKEALAY